MPSKAGWQGSQVGEPRAMGRRRLAFVIYSAFPCYSGGRENWLFNIVRCLDKAGYATTIYSYESDEPPFYDVGDLRNMRLVRVPTLRRRSGRFRLVNRLTLNMAFWLDTFLFVRATYRRLVRECSGGTILAMNPVIDVLPALRLRDRRETVRVACSVRGRVAWELSLRSPWARPLLSWYERRSLAQCDIVLANGHDTQAYLQSRGLTSVVIPNGVDFQRFAHARGGVPETEPLRQMKADGKDGEADPF